MPKGKWPRPSFEERFWAKVNKTDGCWLWTATRGTNGYGRIGVANGRTESAHRVSWRFANGDPGDLFVLHRCDVRLCVRPDHLWLGTQADNIRDMVEKGRARKPPVSEEMWNARLKPHQVLEIRDRWARGRIDRLSSEFGVSKNTIGQIVHRRTWKSI